MLKQQARLFTKLSILVDLIVVLGAFYGAYRVRAPAGGLSAFKDYLWVMLVVVPTWYFLLARYGLYASIRTTPLRQLLVSLLKVHVIGGVIVASTIFLLEPRGFSRFLFGYFLAFSFLLLSLEKVTIKLGLGYIRVLGYNFRNILIVGTEEKARDFVRLIEEHADWGLRLVGLIRMWDDEIISDLHEYPVVGKLDELVVICRQNPVDEVVFCVTKESVAELEEAILSLEEMGITVRMLLDFYDVSASRTELSLFHGEIPMLTFYSKTFDAEQLLLKRFLDIIGAMVGLVLTVLLFPFIVLAIKLDSPGPLFFFQERVGENGRIFKCWKFRSMYVDAEERKKELLHLNEMNGALFKIRNDPRITRVGAFLRRTSLDELPQFWNVLRGEMSLVGTRPPTPDEVAIYENWQRRRICIKPGITGLWQVSGRNEIRHFDEVVRLDLEYIDRWNLWLDIKILLKTVLVVFARTGSC
jgi:exopolysaccharide biosynthesis polyprenyl glycosylphosphotransferase